MMSYQLFGVLLSVVLSFVTPTTADSNSVALSDWIPGILTPYGGDEPTVPSYGVTIVCTPDLNLQLAFAKIAQV